MMVYAIKNGTLYVKEKRKVYSLDFGSDEAAKKKLDFCGGLSMENTYPPLIDVPKNLEWKIYVPAPKAEFWYDEAEKNCWMKFGEKTVFLGKASIPTDEFENAEAALAISDIGGWIHTSAPENAKFGPWKGFKWAELNGYVYVQKHGKSYMFQGTPEEILPAVHKGQHWSYWSSCTPPETLHWHEYLGKVEKIDKGPKKVIHWSYVEGYTKVLTSDGVTRFYSGVVECTREAIAGIESGALMSYSTRKSSLGDFTDTNELFLRFNPWTAEKWVVFEKKKVDDVHNCSHDCVKHWEGVAVEIERPEVKVDPEDEDVRIAPFPLVVEPCPDFNCELCWAWVEFTGKEMPMSVGGARKRAPGPRTQKAKGLVPLRGLTGSVPQFAVTRTEIQVRQGVKSFGMRKILARPAPFRARHGFLESRPVGTVEEAIGVLKETLKIDKKGELILMQRIDPCKFSGVWTPGMLSIGAGNDGATSGKDTKVVPLVKHGFGTKELMEQAGITEAPYVEFVVDKNGNVYYVQLRNGPAVVAGMTGDYVPKDMVVKDVITAEGDLLEWESKVKELGEGTVVWHPGGSWLSHYAVHCRYAGIPVVFGERPGIGSELKKTRVEELDPAALRDGLNAGYAMALGDGTANYATIFVAAVLHNAVVMTGKASFWLGAACALMVRLGTAAAMGEYRHRRDVRVKGQNREARWQRAFTSKGVVSRFLPAMLKGFVVGQWGGGFGGQAWANCVAATLKLDDAVQDMLAGGKPEDLILALNIVVNEVHNGGWWLNKFCDKSTFDMIAKGDFVATMKMIHAVWGLDRTETIAKLKRLKWRRIVPKPAWVEIARLDDYDKEIHVYYGWTREAGKSRIVRLFDSPEVLRKAARKGPDSIPGTRGWVVKDWTIQSGRLNIAGVDITEEMFDE